MVSGSLSPADRRCLLDVARESVDAAARSLSLPELELGQFSLALHEPKACFVTLHKRGELRGCTGVLVARAPLALEVRRTAAQTALYDPRFDPVSPDEVPDLDIEISVLTVPERLHLEKPQDLPRLIRPGIDGVTLIKGPYRATFLPQVWERVPDPELFLGMLCQKMGLSAVAWRLMPMEVEVYQVEEFSDRTVAQAQ